MQKSGINPVPGTAPTVRHLAEKFCTRSEYFTTSNCVFNFNFLALAWVSDIIGGPKFTLRGLRPPDAPRGKFWHTPSTCLYLYKCIGNDTKSATRQSPNCIKNNKKIYGEKRFSIWRMELLHLAMWHDHDIDFARWLHPAMWHVALKSWQWIHQVATPCNVIRGSGMTCHGIRPNVLHIVILHLVSILTISPQSTCHSAPVCEILSKSDHPMSIFKMADLSHLGF